MGNCQRTPWAAHFFGPNFYMDIPVRLPEARRRQKLSV